MAGDTVFYAHSKEDTPPAQWQTLEEHLRGTAKRAATMAGDSAALNGAIWPDCGTTWGSIRRTSKRSYVAKKKMLNILGWGLP